MYSLLRFMRFSHYAILRESLLNKRADVTPGGEYVTPFKVPKHRPLPPHLPSLILSGSQ